MSNDLYNVNSFRRSHTGAVIMRAKPGMFLPLAQIKRFAPTVFAQSKHDSRSDRFAYVSTATVLERLMSEGFDPVEVRTGGSRDADKRDHTKHAIRLRQRGETAARHIGEVRREVTVGNAHDGSSSFFALSALWRLACLNGLVVSDGPGSEIRVNHSGDIVDKVVDAAFTVIDHGAEVDRSIDRMKATILAQSAQDELAEAALALRYGDAPPISPRALLSVRRRADEGSDLWTVFNRVQEALIERAGLPYRTRSTTGRITNRRTNPVNGIDDNISLNQKLWAIAANAVK